MDSKKILKYQIFSAIFAIILGAILHFTYEWSGNNAFVATFSSINESTWEHLKLAFFPMLITAIIRIFCF
jgi:ABC-type Fe3+-siderophore transport system permease subunit